MPKFTATLNVPQYSSAPGSANNGDVYYNTTSNTFYAYINGVWTDLAAGGGGHAPSAESVRVQVRNVTASTIGKGSIVMLKGVNGQKPTIEKAIATSDAYSAATLGWVENDIATNTDGYVTTFGILNNLDTQGFSDGQYLYLSGTTAGAATSTKTYAPVHNVTVGFVVKGGSAGAGQVFVLIKNGYELDEIHDVATHDFPPSDGQSLSWDNANSLWKPRTKSAVYYSASEPTGGTYYDGDIWVDSDDETLQATGPQGPTGATGPTGPTGATGATGPSGDPTLVIPTPYKTSTYTFASGDESDLLIFNSASALVAQIPTDATFNFAIGTQINIVRYGAGALTVAAVTPATTTVRATPGNTLRAQYSTATCIKLAANEWLIVGDLS